MPVSLSSGTGCTFSHAALRRRGPARWSHGCRSEAAEQRKKMATQRKTKSRDTAKIALLAGIIVVALILLIVSYVRSNATSGTIQTDGVKHIRQGARERRAYSPPGTMGQ